MELFDLYLISILPSFREFFSLLAFLCLVCTVIGGIMCCMAVVDGYRVKKCVLIVPLLGLFFGILSALTPSEKQLYFIAGGYAATNVEGIEKLPSNLTKAANTWLERLAEEVKE